MLSVNPSIIYKLGAIVITSIACVGNVHVAASANSVQKPSPDCRFFKPVYDKFWKAYMELPQFHYYPPGHPLAYGNPKGRRAPIEPSARLAAGWEATQPTSQDWKFVLERGTNNWKLVGDKALRDAMQGMTSGRTYTEAVLNGYWVSHFKKAMNHCGLRNKYSDKYPTRKDTNGFSYF